MYFFFKDTATTEIYTLSLHDALPISRVPCQDSSFAQGEPARKTAGVTALLRPRSLALAALVFLVAAAVAAVLAFAGSELLDDRSVAIPLVLVLLASGGAALLGWSAERARRNDLAQRHDDELARLEGEAARREAERRDAAAAELEATRADARAEAARRDERE